MTIRARRRIVTAYAITLLVATQAPALGEPDGGPPRTPEPPRHLVNCPLERVGTQFVRCDNLTGAGVPAPEWVPEYGSTVPTT
jgi:hypothetical protein